MAKKSLLFPESIRSAREQQGWTQTEMAELIGVTQSTISFWERGIENPSLEHQVKLVTILPEIFEVLAQRENTLLSRLYRLERSLNKSRCGDTCCCAW